MSGMLRMDFINGLPQPFIATFYGGSEWPVETIDVETGLMHIDVCGKLDRTHIGEVKFFTDADGIQHEADSFYSDWVAA